MLGSSFRACATNFNDKLTYVLFVAKARAVAPSWEGLRHTICDKRISYQNTELFSRDPIHTNWSRWFDRLVQVLQLWDDLPVGIYRKHPDPRQIRPTSGQQVPPLLVEV